MTHPAAGRQDETRAALVATVQYNCDVGDARHAREGALCTYLLGMRELYRWSSGAAPGAPPDRGAVGAFITAREAAWDALYESDASYRPLPLGAGIEPFEEARTDAALRARGLVYGGGIGRFGAPVFFLAERLHETVQEGLTVVHAGLEFARGIVAPPATSRDGRIVVRTDAMRRWLWTRVEAGPHRGRAGELAALLAACGTTTAQAIERLVADQADTLVLHELGEVRAGALLGPDWERMLLALDDRRAESVARAVRDLLADCLVTLPALVERRETVALRFWFANLEGLRRSLALRLAALATRRELDLHAILDASAAEHTHHRDTALGLLESWRAGGAPAVGQTVDALLANAQAA